MKQEAIAALEQFKQMHLATDGQVDTMSESPKVNLSRVPKKINYPAHVKPLKERIMSALNNGCRTPDSVATYCAEEIKLITLQLGRWVSRGLIGKHTNVVSGITRYYPYDLAKEKGFLVDPQPIVRKKGKKAKLKTENRSSPFVHPKSLEIADRALAPIRAKEKDYIAFLENRVTAWAQESRKQAHEITKLQDALIEARKTRDVTSEVTEVMQEVTKLRATVAYLESKLFGSK
jgi:hypothetical protein